MSISLAYGSVPEGERPRKSHLSFFMPFLNVDPACFFIWVWLARAIFRTPGKMIWSAP
jgi:hypothetical protein